MDLRILEDVKRREELVEELVDFLDETDSIRRQSEGHSLSNARPRAQQYELSSQLLSRRWRVVIVELPLLGRRCCVVVVESSQVWIVADCGLVAGPSATVTCQPKARQSEAHWV